MFERVPNPYRTSYLNILNNRRCDHTVELPFYGKSKYFLILSKEKKLPAMSRP